MRFQSSTNTNYQWFAGIECIMPRQSLRFKNLSRAIAVMLNVDMYTETPCKKTLEIYCDIFCHHHHQIAIIINHHHHYHHHDHHNLTVQAGTMKQGTLPRNHLPVKAVIGVMGAAVRHISWRPSVTIEVLGAYEVCALRQSAQKLLWLQSNMWTFPCIFTFNCKQLVFRHPQKF